MRSGMPMEKELALLKCRGVRCCFFVDSCGYFLIPSRLLIYDRTGRARDG